jgi:hypothetical protein
MIDPTNIPMVTDNMTRLPASDAEHALVDRGEFMGPLNTPIKLLTAVVYDMKLVEASEKFTLDMGEWFHARKRVYDITTCAVCAIGSVIAMRGPLDPEHDIIADLQFLQGMDGIKAQFINGFRQNSVENTWLKVLGWLEYEDAIVATLKWVDNNGLEDLIHDGDIAAWEHALNYLKEL